MTGRLEKFQKGKRDGEFRAGPLIPLLDQAATGVSTGTFDVVLDDASATDIALFRSMFPALGEMPIETTLLTPFDRARVERIIDSGTWEPVATAATH